MSKSLPTSARAILNELGGDAKAARTNPTIPRRVLLGGGTLAAVGAAVGTTLAGGAKPRTAVVPPADLSGLPVFDITEAPFNADPTGGTDATGAIVAAIAAAGANGRIYAPSGTYLITGAANNNGPIVFVSSGLLEGAGGASSSGTAATTFKCGDATAGIVLNGNGAASNFTVDGNHVATTPLQRGLQAGAGCYGTFTNITVIDSAQDGWTIISSQNDAYYSCASVGSARDNLYIDGGAGGLDFFHWNDSQCGRYGIHGDGLIDGTAGTYITTTEAVRFWGGITEGGGFAGFGESGGGVSRIYLAHAIDWAFPHMNVVGTKASGPTVAIDQATCYAIDFSHSLIWANTSYTAPGYACIEIAGGSGYGGDIIVDGAYFVAGDTSIYVTQGAPTIFATSIMDHTKNGPIGGGSCPDINSLLIGTTGPWILASLGAGWLGSLHYRIDGLGRVEFKGRIIGPSGQVACTLPKGLYPVTDPQLLAIMGTGIGTVAISSDNGQVTPTEVSGDATKGVVFDGLSFPTT
jgi:hypothetical protein